MRDVVDTGFVKSQIFTFMCTRNVVVLMDFCKVFCKVFVDSCHGGGVDLFMNALYSCVLFKLQLFYNLLFHAQMRVREEERISMLNKKTIGAFVAAATLLSGFAFASLPPVALASTNDDNKIINFQNPVVKKEALYLLNHNNGGGKELTDVTEGQAKRLTSIRLNTNTGDSNNFSDLKYFTSLKKVSLWTSAVPTGLDSLKSLHNLESLRIGSTLRKVNISDISGLTNLKSLEINNATNLDDTKVNELKDLTKLKKLTITGSDITNFSSLNFLPADLEELDVSGASKIENINGIDHFKNLKLLNIIDTSVSDLSPITAIKDTITDLEANTKNGINSIEPLSKLTKLNYLLFRSSNNISSIEKLKSLTGLKTLVITGGNNIRDISPVNSMSSLSALALYDFISLSNISSIEKNTSLECFSLITSSVNNIDVLNKLPKIKKLALVDNKLTIDTINPIKSLNELTKLVIDEKIGLDKVNNLLGSKSGLKISSIPVDNIHPLPIHSWDGFPVFEPDVVGDDPYVTSVLKPAPAPEPAPHPAPAPDPSSHGNQGHIAAIGPRPLTPKIEPHKPLIPKRSGSSDSGSSAPESAPETKPTSGEGNKPAPDVKPGNDKNVNAPVKVPAAPKTVNELKQEVKGKITVGNNNVAQAGAPNKVTLHVNNAKFNAELKKKGSAKAYAFIYSTPKLLRSVDGSDFVTVKLGADGVPYFDAQFPAGYSGKHTVVLLDEDGNQLAWTDITVANDAAGQADGKGVLPVTGAAGVLVVFAALMFAAFGAALRRVRI